MKETVIISWNFTNWVTVILMAFIGWAIFRTVTNFVKRDKATA